MNKIYFYTSPTYESFSSASTNNKVVTWGKVGQTHQQSVVDRVAQQDGTAVPEKLIIKKTWDVPSHVTDYVIHKQLEQNGIRRVRTDKSREWFECGTKDVDVAINQILHGVARPDSYSMRPEQQECHDKAVAHYLNGGEQFLLNGKMGFGKTFSAYQIIKTLELSRVLILTYRPQVEDSWRNDFETHVDFDGWEYLFAKDFSSSNPVKFNPGSHTQILFASFQDLNESNKAKWKNLLSFHFDLVCIDEQHFGSATPRAQKTLEQLSYDAVLEISGTPLHALMSGRFFDEEIYTWSYVDEQQKRLEEKNNGWSTEVYRWLPQMKFMTFNVSDKAKSLCSYYSDDEHFTLQKMFGSEDGISFVDEAAVSLWLEEAYGVTGHKKNSPIRQFNADHLIWRMSSVNSCLAMEKLLKKTPWVKHVPIVVSGDEGAKIGEVRRHIRDNDKTITLSCGALMTGITVPEWSMIFMLDGGSSAQEYFQTIFRVQRSNKKAEKEVCYVVDYAPQRTLQMVYDYAFVQSEVNGKSTSKNIREFLDFAPILDHTENSVKETSVSSVIDFVASTSNAIEKFGSHRNFYFDAISDEVKEVLYSIEDNLLKKNDTKKVEVNDNGLTKGKNYKAATTKQQQKNPSANKRAEERKLQQLSVSLLKRLPMYAFVEIYKNDEQVDCLDDILRIANDELLQEELGITSQMLQTLVDEGFLNKKRVDLCLISFHQMKNRLLKTDDLIEKIEKSIMMQRILLADDTESATDFDVALKMIDELDVSKVKRLLDPACGRGTFLLAALKRMLEKGMNLYDALNKLYGVEIDKSQFSALQASFKSVLGYVPRNLIQGDSLKDEAFTQMMKNFDAIVMNPPYLGNKRMHQKFFNRMTNDLLEENGTLVSIQPAIAYFNKKDKIDSDTALMQENIKRYKTKVEIVDPRVFPNVAIYSDLSITTLKKKETNDEELTKVKYKSGAVFNEVSLENVNKTEIEPNIYSSIVSKYKKLISKSGSLTDLLSFDKTAKKARLAIIRGSTPQIFYTFMPKDESYWDTKGDFGVLASSDQEVKNIYSYLKTNFARFGLAIMKFNQHLSGTYVSMVPLVDFSRTYTDEELYDMIGLTQEERDTIDSVLPDYYDLKSTS